MKKSNLIVALALIGFVTMTACTRSGGGGNPPPIEQQPAPVATPIPPSSRSELDNDTSKSAQDSKTASSAGPQVSRDEDPTYSRSAPTKTAPSRRDGSPEQITYDPTGLTPSEIFARSARQGLPVTGDESDVPNGQSNEPLYYSGAGQDDLREELQTWVNSKSSSGVASRNREFAKRVLNGRFDVNWQTRQTTLDITVRGEKGARVYRFSSPLSNRQFFSSGNVKMGDKLAIDGACMDLNGGCSTVYVKVQEANGIKISVAHMIIRQTEATLFTHAQGFGIANNPEFDALLETMVRTDHHSGELNALNSLKLRTSETINGQASFRVEMGIRSAYNTQETLNLGGPLVKPAEDYNMTASAQLLRSTSPAANTIRSVLLTRNDGRGTLTLAVTVRKATPASQEDTMDLTFSRLHKPTRPLMIK